MTKKIAQIHLDENDIELVSQVLAKEFADVFSYYTDKPIEGFKHFQKIMKPIIKRVLLSAPSFSGIEIPESLGEEIEGKLKATEEVMKEKQKKLAQVPLVCDETLQEGKDKIEEKVTHLGVEEELEGSLGVTEQQRQMYPVMYVAERLVRDVEKQHYSSMQAAFDDVTKDSSCIYGKFDDPSREHLAKLLDRMGYKVSTKEKEKDKRTADKKQGQEDLASLHLKLNKILEHLSFLVEQFTSKD